jgi:hypothetical protein
VANGKDGTGRVKKDQHTKIYRDSNCKAGHRRNEVLYHGSVSQQIELVGTKNHR